MYPFTADIQCLSGGSTSIAPNGSAEGYWTNEASKDLIVTKIGLVIALASTLNGAIAGSEVARWPSPTAADNTHVTRAQFRFRLETTEGQPMMNGPVNVAGFFNPEGLTYLEEPFRVPARGSLRLTFYNDSPTATVKCDAILRGLMVEPGAVFNPSALEV